MTHHYYAVIEAHIRLTEEELYYLLEAAKRHYDGTVNGMAEVGGFLYGVKGRYEFMKSQGNIEDWGLELNLINRKIQLLYKAVEFDSSPQAMAIKEQLWPIITGFNDVHESVNKTLIPLDLQPEQWRTSKAE